MGVAGNSLWLTQCFTPCFVRWVCTLLRNISLGERPLFFGALSPKPVPPGVGGVGVQLRKALDGITTGDGAQKAAVYSVPTDNLVLSVLCNLLFPEQSKHVQ